MPHNAAFHLGLRCLPKYPSVLGFWASRVKQGLNRAARCLIHGSAHENMVLIAYAQNNTSGAGSDNNHAHPDTSMKLGRNVH